MLAVFLPVRAFSLQSTLPHNLVNVPDRRGQPNPFCPSKSKRANRADANQDEHKHDTDHADHEKDTIRVRIWRALACGDELSMTQLSKKVGERNRGNLRSHLVHVERQAKTIRNKSIEWRARRGLPSPAEMGGGRGVGAGGPKKLRLKTRRGAKNEVFIRLV